jgi:hypothetical protein
MVASQESYYMTPEEYFAWEEKPILILLVQLS